MQGLERLTGVEPVHQKEANVLRMIALRLWDSPHKDQKYPCFANPVHLEQKHLAGLSQREYGVSLKSDGVRVGLLLLQDARGVKKAFVFDRCWRFWKLPEGDVRADDRLWSGSIIDGELICTENEKLCLQFFDLVSCANRCLRRCTYPDRFSLLAYVCNFTPGKNTQYVSDLEGLALFARRADWINELPDISPHLESLSLSFCLKPLVPLNEIERALSSHTLMPSDGLIFTPLLSPLGLGTQNDLYKWKPEHTLDFLCSPSSHLSWVDTTNGSEISDWGKALNGQLDGVVLRCQPPIHHTSLLEYKTLIGRCQKGDLAIWCKPGVNMPREFLSRCRLSPGGRSPYDPLCLVLEFVRIRKDKSAPNNHRTVVATIESLFEPITFETLWKISRHSSVSKRVFAGTINPRCQ